MTDEEAVKSVVNEYKSLNTSSSITLNDIKVIKVNKDILDELLAVCDSHKHIEEQIQWYTDESDYSFNNWIDVEGEGYGWLWLKEIDNEDKWHSLIKNSLIKYIQKKKDELKEDDKVIVVSIDDTIVYHFIEREKNMCDVVYRFSNDILFY